MKKTKILICKLLILCMVLNTAPLTVHAANLTVGSSGASYTTLAAALAAAVDGDTITLLTDITESVNYTTVEGTTIIIDGQNHTITGTDGNPSVAFTVSGSGVLKFKNINLLGGTSTSDYSAGLEVFNSASVQSEGNLTATGGVALAYSSGVISHSSGSVNVDEATHVANASSTGVGAWNWGAGTLNVTTANGFATAVDNMGTGVINVDATSSFAKSIVNRSTGTVNANTATSDRGDGITNAGGGKVNVAHSVNNIANYGSFNENVAVLLLNKGTGANCVLDSIIVAATGTTQVGILPNVYKNGVDGVWYTEGAKQNPFSGTAVSGPTILYSTYCPIYTVSGKITGSDAPGGLAANLQLKDSNDNFMGNSITAESDGTYAMDIPEGTGYTIDVALSGYGNGTISSFDVAGNVTGKDLTLTQAFNVSGTIIGSDSGSPLAASLQLKDSGGNNLGSPVTANADGSYTIPDMPIGTGYTIAVTMEGYYDGITPAFDISDANVIANLILQKKYTVSGTIIGSDTNSGLAASLQLKDGEGNDFGVPVTAAADGTYTLTAPSGSDYTIVVTKSRYYEGLIPSFDIATDVTNKNLTLQRAVQTVGTGGGYSTLTAALAGADNGDTITLLNNITESVDYSTVANSTIRINGQGHTITGVNGEASVALKLQGSGTIVLKNLNLVGGTASVSNSFGLDTAESVNVQCEGTVNTTGGAAVLVSGGLQNYSAGVVNITTATGGASTFSSVGVWNGTFGKTNVNTATGGHFGILARNVGTVNATTAIGGNVGVYNESGCNINVTSSTGVTNMAAGIVNVRDNTGIASGAGQSYINTDVASITLNKGAGASCVLDSVTIAATGTTYFGVLPGVYKDGVKGNWYIDSNKNTLFNGLSVAGATELYSTFYGGVASVVPVITTAGLLEGTVDTFYSVNCAATGTAPVTWAVTAGTLPAGLSLSNEGLLSGTPIAAGTSAFSLTATNGAGSDTENYSLIIKNKTTGGSSSGGSGGGSGGGTQPVTTPTPTPTAPAVTVPTSTSATSTTTTEAKSVLDGKAIAVVTEGQMTEALNKAVQSATDGGIQKSIEIKVTAQADAKTIEASIPKTSFNALADSKIDALTVSTPIAALTFDEQALSTIAQGATEDVKISVSKVDTSALSEETKQTIGDKPVFNFSVTSGDQAISQFGGNVSVSVPYTPKAGEDTNAIVIYYINSEGKLETVSNCSYDPATGNITFTTNHFSKYAVGYNKVSFKDVASNAWFNNAISFVAARGITTGTGNGNFSPEANLTRGEFLVMLMRAYGLSADENAQDNFSDSGNSYFTGYLAAAKKLGIATGVGNNMFAPNKEITRQEMVALLYKTLEKIGQLPGVTTEQSLSKYSDAITVAPWAKEAMSLFVGDGIINGSNNQLSPNGLTTRAEMAQVLYKLMSK